jgi:hypothetical protein
MAKKHPEAFENAVGGIDLLIERDAGNEVRILTGNKKNSLEFWHRLSELCTDAIDTLSPDASTLPNSGIMEQLQMIPEDTGYTDDNGHKIFVGAILKSVDGYHVRVYKTRSGNKITYHGKLIWLHEAEHISDSCKDIPYALNDGKGYSIVGYSIVIEPVIKPNH